MKIKSRISSFSQTKSTHQSRITFSLEYITMNASHTFDYFGKNMREELAARQSLSVLLKELSRRSWMEIAQIGKKTQCGFETLPAMQLRFTPSGYEFSRDEKVWVFRFGKQQYRLIGIQDDRTLYVIGYDFDFSAYNH